MVLFPSARKIFQGGHKNFSGGGTAPHAPPAGYGLFQILEIKIIKSNTINNMYADLSIKDDRLYSLSSCMQYVQYIYVYTECRCIQVLYLVYSIQYIRDVLPTSVCLYTSTVYCIVLDKRICLNLMVYQIFIRILLNIYLSTV